MALYATIPPKMHRIFFKYDEKKMSSMVSISADWNEIGLNTANFQLAENDTEFLF